MSRISDTRERTREAAANLVAAGRRPHEITVDLIYASIQQGSRTTINDALKRWKDDRAKADALAGDLPPPIAEAMRSLWAAAVEQGEALFDQHRQDIETQLTAERVRSETAEAALQSTAADAERLAGERDSERARHAETTAALAAARESAAASEVRAVSLEQQLGALRTQSERDQAQLRETAERQSAEFRDTLAERDRVYHTEIERATSRLESAQTHMLKQIDDTREAQKKSDAAASKALQRADQLNNDLIESRMQLATQSRELQQARQQCEQVQSELSQIREERGQRIADQAMLKGQVDALNTQLQDYERRAISAEARLDRALESKMSGRTRSGKTSS